MSELTLPIVIVDGQDIAVYPSVGDAEKALEPWWIRKGAGAIYDAAGHLLRGEIAVEQDKHPVPILNVGPRENVRIQTNGPFVDSSETLRAHLVAHLKATQSLLSDVALMEAPLATLVGRIEKA